jgi:hypothetical protein
MRGESPLSRGLGELRLSRDVIQRAGVDRYECLRQERSKLVNLLCVMKPPPVVTIIDGEVTFVYPDPTENEKQIHQYIAWINSMLPEFQRPDRKLGDGHQ